MNNQSHIKNSTLPAGTYYIGDLCYVLNESWGKCCDAFFAGRSDHGCNEGIFEIEHNGKKILFASFGTAYGDGGYYDQNGKEYFVDSGSIGAVLLSNIDLTNPNNKYEGLGQVHTFKKSFLVGTEHGKIRFGDVEINTDPEDEEEED